MIRLVSANVRQSRVWMLALVLVLSACKSSGSEKTKWLKIAKQIAEDPMNSSSEFVRRQLAQGRAPNRLIQEKSPYLLQHAFNPVDWYPWGEEAFARAKSENRPIFLSIGYSTCHWCHVMEHETFENAEIAALMNADFINIKVDREERPDVDRVYMAAVQSLTGSGGWPMSVFLTPELKPFYAGTYFPPQSKFGRPGFVDVITRIREVWSDQREKVLTSAAQITDMLRQQVAVAGAAAKLDPADLQRVFAAFQQRFDPREGGFGQAPKFPRPAVFNFLFAYSELTGETAARDMALQTLEKMHAGGMYDHLGGGFHRYSVDARWRVPHFEKMLYDQAQLANSYLDAYQISRRLLFAAAARDILDYVLCDMTSPAGAFYSAEDADSAPDIFRPDEKVEGAFYMWTVEETAALLGTQTAEIFNYAYGLEPQGNTLSDPHGEFGVRNVLFLAHDPASVAKRFHRSTAEITTILQTAQHKLLAQRENRPRPLRDDKIITAWNGLMISALARAGFLLETGKYTAAAKNAADFLLQNLWDGQGRALHRRYRDGEARYPAHLDDYAFLANGLVDLYEASAELRYLKVAAQLAEEMVHRFGDAEQGGFFDSADEAKELLFRSKALYDGAEPSGTAMAVLALLRLGRMLDQKQFIAFATRTLEQSVAAISRAPSAFPQLAVALQFALATPLQIVLAGPPDAAGLQNLLAEVRKTFLPNRVILYADGGDGQAWLAEKMAVVSGMTPLHGKPAAYVCENFACELPTSDAGQLATLLTKYKLRRSE